MSDPTDPMIAARDEATRVVVESDHPLRLIVSGPGTGKSFAFKQALRRKGAAPGLALTFIKTLAAELAKDLGSDADTYTFHAYSKHLFHQLQPGGLTRAFSLYPPLFELMTEDLGLLGWVGWTAGMSDRAFDALKAQVDRTIMELDPSSSIPANVLALGTYYDAASFNDLVYRVFLHLEDNADATPEYPLVVVDEYQDFSRLETAFIAQLGLKSPLLIAGDDDQALYKFRHASPEHIRNLADSTDVERHVLPYCSRCTEVVVAAVNATIDRAVRSGHLQERLTKPFECYMPDKRDDSRAYPELIDARCSIHRYMGQYVESEIAKISQSDIDASVAGRHKTVLVIGPKQFMRPIYEHLKAGAHPQAELRASEPLPVVPIDGYRFVARDPASNLGWRILVHCDPFPGWQDVAKDSLTAKTPLAPALPVAWRDERLAIAATLRRALAGEAVDERDLERLASVAGMSRDSLMEYIHRGEPSEESEGARSAPVEEQGAPAEGPDPPSILCTTLKGAKGLSAEHVFVVGLSNRHFPVNPGSVSDDEICEFLVALSRTRKQCHLVSTRIFAGPPPLRPSLFLAWVAPNSRQITVDRNYW